MTVKTTNTNLACSSHTRKCWPLVIFVRTLLYCTVSILPPPWVNIPQYGPHAWLVTAYLIMNTTEFYITCTIPNSIQEQVSLPCSNKEMVTWKIKYYLTGVPLYPQLSYGIRKQNSNFLYNIEKRNSNFHFCFVFLCH